MVFFCHSFYSSVYLPALSLSARVALIDDNENYVEDAVDLASICVGPKSQSPSPRLIKRGVGGDETATEQSRRRQKRKS